MSESPPMDPFFAKLLAAREADPVPSFHEMTPDEGRALMRMMIGRAPPPGDLPALAEVVDETIAGPHGPIPIRRYVPVAAPRGTCVYFHAGGWVLGDIDTGDKTCQRIAGRAGLEVVNVDYRLAPEHPYPQPLDDAYAALLWAGRRRDEPLFIAGESAGGNLAAACAIRARDEGGPAIAGQLLAYAVLDHSCDTGSYRAFGDRPWLLSRPEMIWFWNHYSPSTESRSDALLSPLRVKDALGLPPLFLAVGELDVLRDEGLAYADKLRAAGVDVTVRCDPGMVHGYIGMAEFVTVAGASLDAAVGWMTQKLS